MTTTSQLISAIRFCDDNRPNFINRPFWDTVVTLALTDHSKKAPVEFSHMDVYWDALDYARTSMKEEAKRD